MEKKYGESQGNLSCSENVRTTWWPQHRENREFDYHFFQTGKTQGI